MNRIPGESSPPTPAAAAAPPLAAALHQTRHPYLAKVRHDLRTPINHILGYGEMLLEETGAPAWTNFGPAVQRILEAARQILDLVNQTFDPARSDSPGRDVRSIQHQLRTPLTVIIGYAELLQEQACEFEQRAAAADLGKIRGAGHALLERIEAHLFGPEPGTDDARGSGEPEWPTTDGSADATPTVRWEGCKVLVVDDDPANREVLERRLQRHGFSVASAGGGPEALDLLRRQNFDLILLDMIMPGMDGFRVLRAIKSDKALRDHPVIMLSASDDAATAVHCIKMGADDFLPKPTHATLLLARMEASMAKRRLREMHRTEVGFYSDKGTLPLEAPSYVERSADRELVDALTAREYCYVLTSRQMGKSSLMVRAAARLRERGARVAILDLTSVGVHVTPDQWYGGLLMRFGRQLRLEDELEEFWLRQTRLSPVQRWFAAVRRIVLSQTSFPVVIFVDELDTLRSLPFSGDEFLAAIRSAYNARSVDAEMHRLVFCLLGVAPPDAIAGANAPTPFNVSRRIELTDLDPANLALLARGFHRPPETAEKLLQRVYHWTRGHPYLTQRLCRSLAADPSAADLEDVDRWCERLFLTPKAREEDDNLVFVKKALLCRFESREAVLRTYFEVLAGARPLRDTDPPQILDILRWAGVVRITDHELHVRNPIYARVFDRDWVNAQLAGVSNDASPSAT